MAELMSRTSRVRLLVVLLVLLVGCDQASKHYADTHWKDRIPRRQSFLNDTFRIEYAENIGAFLGLFGGLAPEVRRLILVTGNGVGMVVLVSMILGASQIDRWSFIAWALVFVGGIGNLIDRIRINAVIDFLNLGIGEVVRTGIFNVADMAITAGFLMLLPQLFRSPTEEGASPATPPSPAETSPAPASSSPV